jgi:hypothetical protein
MGEVYGLGLTHIEFKRVSAVGGNSLSVAFNPSSRFFRCAINAGSC